MIEWVVQIDRNSLTLLPLEEDKDIREEVLKHPKVQEAMIGRDVLKMIVMPTGLINILTVKNNED